MAAPMACEVMAAQSLEGNLSRLADALKDNYIMLSISVGVAVAGFFCVWFLVGNVLSAFRAYKHINGTAEPALKANSMADGYDALAELDTAAPSSDYDKYAPRKRPEEPTPPPTEREQVNKTLSDLKAKYAVYNKEVTAYERNVRNREGTDDVMDERILSAKEDKY